MRRVGLVLLATAGLLVALAQPAGAHGAGGIVATNFVPSVGGLTPALPGVRVRVIEAGTRLELRNDGPEVVVLGDEGEPYLRVGPDGTFENRQSPTARRSHGLDQDPAATQRRDPNAPPEWRQVSATPVARWDEQRIRWTASRPPPEVERRPRERHVVFPRWEIGIRRGDAPAVIFGTLTWAPGPSPVPWIGIMAAAFLSVGALGLRARWGTPLAAATAAVLAVDITHAASVAFAFAGGLGTHLARLVTGGFYGMLGWVLAVVAVRLLRRGNVDGLFAATFAGLSMALFGGLLDLATLSRRVSLSTLPPAAARLCIALSGGAGLGLAVACLLVIRRTPAARRVVGNDPADGASAHGTATSGGGRRPDGPVGDAVGVAAPSGGP